MEHPGKEQWKTVAFGVVVALSQTRRFAQPGEMAGKKCREGSRVGRQAVAKIQGIPTRYAAGRYMERTATFSKDVVGGYVVALVRLNVVFAIWCTKGDIAHGFSPECAKNVSLAVDLSSAQAQQRALHAKPGRIARDSPRYRG